MYELVSHYKCKHCGNTNCLFKLRRDEYLYKTTGNIKYKTMSTCKICYLENCRIKNYNFWDKNKESLLLNQTIYRITHKEEYNKRARGYYKKRRLKTIEQKKNKYIPKIRKGILARAKKRDSLLSRVYLQEVK